MKSALIPCAFLLAAGLLSASCGDGSPPEPGPAPTSAGAAAPKGLEDLVWDPRDLISRPEELVAQPGSGDTWIEGVVEDPTGKPLAGATVEVAASPHPGALVGVPLVHAGAESGPDGRFRVGPGPTPWSRAGVLLVSAPGFAPTALVNRATVGPGEPCAEPGREVRVRLRPGIPVRCEVRCEDGGPPEAPVTLWAVGMKQFSRVMETDADGAVEFLAPEDRIFVTTMGGTHPIAQGSVDVRPGSENLLSISVVRGRDIPVRILDDLTGEPVRGAYVLAHYGRSTLVPVPDDGNLVLRSYWHSAFQVYAPGYEARFHTIPADAGTPGHSVLQVRLRRGVVARGKVLDLDGAPLAGVRVRSLSRDRDGRWIEVRGGRSGADGSYTFVGLPLPGAGREVRVIGTSPDLAHGVTEPLPVASGALLDGIDLRVPRLVEMEGRLEDEKGAPVQAALEIRWAPPKGLETYAPRVPDRVDVSVFEDGTWTALVPERSRIAVSVVDDAIADALVESSVPAHSGGAGPGRWQEPLVIPVYRGHTIRGSVVDARGAPVGRGEVRIEPSPMGDGRPSKDGHLRPDGTFTLGGLEGGLHDISVVVYPKFLQEVVLGVETDGAPVSVVLRRAGGMRGTIRPYEGAPKGLLAAVTARAEGPTRPLPPQRGIRVPFGKEFRLGPLAPGAYSLTVVAGDRRCDLENLVVEDGEHLDLGPVDLTEPTGVVLGTLRVAGTPAAGVPLEVLRALPGGRYQTVGRALSGPDGAYRVAGLLEGAHLVVVHPRDRPLVKVAFEGKPGEPRTVDIDVPAGGTLAVTVLDGEGRPVPGARVVLQGEAESLHFWKAGSPSRGPHETGKDGTLRCTGVPGGPCRVAVDLPGGGSGEAEVVVEEGVPAVVEVRLRAR